MRAAILRSRGIGTLRIPAWRVLENPAYVADRMLLWAMHLSAKPPPQGEGDRRAAVVEGAGGR